MQPDGHDHVEDGHDHADATRVVADADGHDHVDASRVVADPGSYADVAQADQVIPVVEGGNMGKCR